VSSVKASSTNQLNAVNVEPTIAKNALIIVGKKGIVALIIVQPLHVTHQPKQQNA
jgi:hypothetical protein